MPEQAGGRVARAGPGTKGLQALRWKVSLGRHAHCSRGGQEHGSGHGMPLDGYVNAGRA